MSSASHLSAPLQVSSCVPSDIATGVYGGTRGDGATGGGAGMQ